MAGGRVDNAPSDDPTGAQRNLTEIDDLAVLDPHVVDRSAGVRRRSKLNRVNATRQARVLKGPVASIERFRSDSTTLDLRVRARLRLDREGPDQLAGLGLHDSTDATEAIDYDLQVATDLHGLR